MKLIRLSAAGALLVSDCATRNVNAPQARANRADVDYQLNERMPYAH